jgi:hypothetical protein
MDARANTKSLLPSRRATEGAGRVLRGAERHDAGVGADPFGRRATFKKPCGVPDLKFGGRYVAKDMLEIGGDAIVADDIVEDDVDGGRRPFADGLAARVLGTPWKYVRQAGRGVDGLACRVGEAQELQCYADI